MLCPVQVVDKTVQVSQKSLIIFISLLFICHTYDLDVKHLGNNGYYGIITFQSVKSEKDQRTALWVGKIMRCLVKPTEPQSLLFRKMEELGKPRSPHEYLRAHKLNPLSTSLQWF